MLQPRREPSRVGLGPHPLQDIRGLERHILGVVVKQEVVKVRREVVPEGRRALEGALVTDVARDPRPRAEEALRRQLLVHLQGGLVLQEAGVGPRRAEVLELLVDERGVGQGDVVAGLAEGDKVRGGRVADRVQGCGCPRVVSVVGCVLAGGPEDVVEVLVRVEDGGGCPGHTCCVRLDAVGGCQEISVLVLSSVRHVEGLYAYILNEDEDQFTRSVDFQTTMPRLPVRVAWSHENPSALMSRSGMFLC